ncbi:MAG: hypothetical protein KCHDKBKB_01045 [Elusimicrobia bacterium]|nr:hypothetical protein [Elusimicrobiota bacterium]
MIRVTIKGTPEILALMNAMPNRMRLALFKAMRDTVIVVQSLAKRNAPVWRGLLRASIVQMVTVDGNQIVGQVGSSLPYASVLEFGSKPGKFPNIQQLKVWARRKFGVEDAAFVIGRAIQRRGFAPQPYLEPAAVEAGPRVELIFNGRILETLSELGGR